MIKLKDIFLLKESMTVHPKGASFDMNMSELNDVCNALLGKVLSPILHKLPPDQGKYFQKNGVGFYETIVPDGSYFTPHPEGPGGHGGVGIINFYISGLIANVAQEVLKAILDYLKTLNIQHGTPKKEQSGVYKSEVVRIPVTNNPNKDESPPELNLSNVNAYQIFHNLLQYEGEHSFEMPAKDLIERITTILRHDPEWIVKNTIARTDSDWPEAEQDPQDVDNPHLGVINQLGSGLGARMIGMGLDADTIRERLFGLVKLAKWSIEHGSSEISVG